MILKSLGMMSLLIGLSSCSFDHTSGDISAGLNSKNSSGLSCEQVITEAKLAEFNRNQNRYQIVHAGYGVVCSSEQTINGNTQRTEASGTSGFSLLPNLKFTSAELASDGKSIAVKALLPQITDDEISEILRALGVSRGDRKPTDFYFPAQTSPSYVRFGQGDLFFVSGYMENTIGKEVTVHFSIRSGENYPDSLLGSKFQLFLSNKAPIELLWYPRNSAFRMSRLADSPTVWNIYDAGLLVKSMVRETELTSRFSAYDIAISSVYQWSLDAQYINSLLPELLAYAKSEWQAPVFADNNSRDLLMKLKYIVRIDPKASQRPVLETYEAIDKYQGDTRKSLQFASDYINQKLYSKQQFDLFIESSEALSNEFRTRVWDFATGLARKSGYDKSQTLFAVRVAILMHQTHLPSLNESNPVSVLNKITSGLTANNIDLYFSTVAELSKLSRGTPDAAESAADQLVLPGKLNSQNQANYFSLFNFLKNTAYLSFETCFDTVLKLTSKHELDSQILLNFRAAYDWFVQTHYIAKSAAVEKSVAYINDFGVDTTKLQILKDYFSWLTSVIYLNRSEALIKTEETILKNGLSEQQIQSIRESAEWYMSAIYLNRKDALARSEDLVLKDKLNTQQINLMRSLAVWLSQTLYFNKLDSANKAVAYVSGANPLDEVRGKRMMSLTDWYIHSFYLSKADALKHGETILLNKKISLDQIDAFQDVAEWLVSETWANRQTAIQKAEDYLLTKVLNQTKVVDLKNEFKMQRNLGKSVSDALKFAEAKVFPK